MSGIDVCGQTDLLQLCKQVGEVLQGVRALEDTVRLRHAQVEKLQDLMRADVSVLQAQHADLDDKLNCVIYVMQHDLECLRTGAAANARSVAELLSVVQELRAPVADIVALRSRVAGVVLGLGVVGSVAMWLAEPAYHWIVEQHFLKN